MKATQEYYDYFKLDVKGELSAPLEVNWVHPKGELSAPNNNIYINNNISTKVDTPQSGEIVEDVVYWHKDIAKVISFIKDWCKKYWIIYNADPKETYFGKHLLSKKHEEVLKTIYWEKYEKEDFRSLQRYIDWVLQVSTKIKWWFVVNNAKTLYQDWVKNIEKWKQQTNNVSKSWEKPVYTL